MQAIHKLQQHIQTLAQCDVYLVEDPVDLYYFTGRHLSAGTLLITPTSHVLFVDGRYCESCQRYPELNAQLTSDERIVQWIAKYQSSSPLKIGYQSQKMTVHRRDEYWQRIFSPLAPLEWIASDDAVQQLRTIKTADELDIMRRAAILNTEGFDFVCQQLREGISEKEIGQRLQIFWLERGGQKLAFDPIIAFGPNSALPHHRCSDRTLQRGDTVLIDIGVVLDNYCSDMTRTVFFGAPQPKIAEIYSVVQQAQAAALDACRPGKFCGEIDQIARDVIVAANYGQHFTHSLGHGVGLDIHEAPTLRTKSAQVLESGMVVTIEPGIYLPGVGGVRIEDTIAITPQGYENFTLRSKELMLIN